MEDETLNEILKNFRIFLNTLDLKYVKEEYGALIYEQILGMLGSLEDLSEQIWNKAVEEFSGNKEQAIKKIRSL